VRVEKQETRVRESEKNNEKKKKSDRIRSSASTQIKKIVEEKG
jgi:hypothetical protein